MARAKRYIEGVYNYCDRWCERCPLTARCLVYAAESGGGLLDPTSDPDTHDVFLRRMQQVYERVERTMLAEAALLSSEQGDPVEQAALLEEVERLAPPMPLNPVARQARAYGDSVNDYLIRSCESLAEELDRLAAIDGLAIAGKGPRVSRLEDALDVLQWYQYLILVKLLRAFALADSLPSDANGSAKVALIAIDRSWDACRTLSEEGPPEAANVFSLLAQLDQLRRDTELAFPAAREFSRPGFDAAA